MIESTDESTNKLTEEFYNIKLGDDGYEEAVKKAEFHKVKGNEFVKESNFNEAIKCFTQAIDMKVETPKNAIYYSNRAFINIKLENFGFALSDANKAIEIDKEYVKAYYRRASAYLLLRKFDEALKDLDYLNKHYPNDKDILMKINNTKQERRKKKFLESIQSNYKDDKEDIFFKYYKKTAVEKSYSSLVYQSNNTIKEEVKNLIESSKEQTNNTEKLNNNITDIYDYFKAYIDESWVVQLMEAMKDSKFIHKKFLCQMIYDSKALFDADNSLVNINIPKEKEINVCGDTHGQYYDLLNIFKINGYPSENNQYLFNGDFVDRGSFSVEIVITLIAWKLLYPKSFFMSRGNHESKNLNKMYGFEGEVKSKYDLDIYEMFCQLFCSLPLCHVINNKIFVTHGGLFSKDNVSLKDITSIDRKREPPESGLMCEILWSDPCKLNGRHPSKRGVGLSFGPDVTKKFLEYNKLDMVIRSHEVKQEGYEVEADGKLVTVFSAPNYCDQMGNKGALVKFNGSDEEFKPKYIQFSHVEHPKVAPMKYANPWMMF